MSFDYTSKKLSLESRLQIPTANVDKFLFDISGNDLLQLSKEVDELSKSLHDAIDRLHLISKQTVLETVSKKETHKYALRIKDIKNKIVKHLSGNDGLTGDQLHANIGGGLSTVKRNLAKLVEEGKITKDNSRPVKYFIVKHEDVVPLEPTSL